MPRGCFVSRTCCHQWLRSSAAYRAEETHGSLATGVPDMMLLSRHGTIMIRSNMEQAAGVT